MAAALRPRLREIYDEVVLFTRSEITDLHHSERQVLGDLADLDRLQQAAQGVEIAIHLGGKADEDDFDVINRTNIFGTYNLFEASRHAGIRRVVYASSHHVTGFHLADELVGEESTVRPDTFYGVSKVFGEAVGRLYADKWGLEVVCLRIGVCRERPENSDQLRTWLSIPDSVALVERAAVAELPEKYSIVYGVSNNARRFWDLGSAHELGFYPQDSADAFESDFDASSSFSSTYQGGRFTLEDYSGGTW
jgi:uronate dehydrogenase